MFLLYSFIYEFIWIHILAYTRRRVILYTARELCHKTAPSPKRHVSPSFLYKIGYFYAVKVDRLSVQDRLSGSGVVTCYS